MTNFAGHFGSHIITPIVQLSICKQSGRSRAFREATKCQNWASIEADRSNCSIAPFHYLSTLTLEFYGVSYTIHHTTLSPNLRSSPIHFSKIGTRWVAVFCFFLCERQQHTTVIVTAPALHHGRGGKVRSGYQVCHWVCCWDGMHGSQLSSSSHIASLLLGIWSEGSLFGFVWEESGCYPCCSTISCWPPSHLLEVINL